MFNVNKHRWWANNLWIGSINYETLQHALYLFTKINKFLLLYRIGYRFQKRELELPSFLTIFSTVPFHRPSVIFLAICQSGSWYHSNANSIRKRMSHPRRRSCASGRCGKSYRNTGAGQKPLHVHTPELLLNYRSCTSAFTSSRKRHSVFWGSPRQPLRPAGRALLDQVGSDANCRRYCYARAGDVGKIYG
jgi:hypothetical protein